MAADVNTSEVAGKKFSALADLVLQGLKPENAAKAAVQDTAGQEEQAQTDADAKAPAKAYEEVVKETYNVQPDAKPTPQPTPTDEPDPELQSELSQTPTGMPSPQPSAADLLSEVIKDTAEEMAPGKLQQYADEKVDSFVQSVKDTPGNFGKVADSLRDQIDSKEFITVGAALTILITDMGRDSKALYDHFSAKKEGKEGEKTPEPSAEKATKFDPDKFEMSDDQTQEFTSAILRALNPNPEGPGAEKDPNADSSPDADASDEAKAAAKETGKAAAKEAGSAALQSQGVPKPIADKVSGAVVDKVSAKMDEQAESSNTQDTSASASLAPGMGMGR